MCVSVCFVFQNDKGKKEKEEKGKEWIEEVSGFSRVLTPLVHSLNQYMSMLNFDLLLSFRILHFRTFQNTTSEIYIFNTIFHLMAFH